MNCPSSYGLNERLNQTLVNRIRCEINSGSEKAWSSIAKESLEEYNRTIHSVTKFSPNYLMDGRDSHIVPAPLLECRDLIQDRAEAFRNSLRNFEANKKRIDLNRRKYEFRVDDLVYVENGNKLNRNKLDQIRIGPFRIVRQMSKSMYEVDCGRQKKEANIFHCSKFVPASPPST